MAGRKTDETHLDHPGKDAKAGSPLDVLYNVEGERKPRSGLFEATATVGDLLKSVRKNLDQDDLAGVYREDDNEALPASTLLSSIDLEDGRLLHVVRPGEIVVEVAFNGQLVSQGFRPSTTMDAIVRWAVGALGLEGSSADFQLKYGDEVLAPRDHLGQIAKGQKAIRLALVMKIKPQG